MSKDHVTTVRVSKSIRQLWMRIAAHYGMSMNALIAMLILQEARRLKIDQPKDKE